MKRIDDFDGYIHAGEMTYVKIDGVTDVNKYKWITSDDTILLGVESRTSSPIRIFRNDKLMSNIKGIYPCGEGAGYAGGITTSAMDGIKVFEEIINKII